VTSFKVKINGTWTTPPSYAMPASIGSSVHSNAPVVRWNEPTGRDGNGRPVAASSDMYATIGRSAIGSTGLAWWYDTVGLGTSLSTPIEVRLFNPVFQAWAYYSGFAWRPTYNSGRAGQKLTDFTIRITSLTLLEVPQNPWELWYLDTGVFLDDGYLIL
jgi:hypothetical protein